MSAKEINRQGYDKSLALVVFTLEPQPPIEGLRSVLLSTRTQISWIFWSVSRCYRVTIYLAFRRSKASKIAIDEYLSQKLRFY